MPNISPQMIIRQYIIFDCVHVKLLYKWIKQTIHLETTFFWYYWTFCNKMPIASKSDIKLEVWHLYPGFPLLRLKTLRRVEKTNDSKYILRPEIMWQMSVCFIKICHLRKTVLILPELPEYYRISILIERVLEEM